MPALLPDIHLKEEARMKYVNAREILPEKLVKELQSYIQGGYVYIPVDRARQKRWGEVSGYRQQLRQRNLQILEAYRSGVPVRRLAEAYFLSIHAIRKILYQK